MLEIRVEGAESCECKLIKRFVCENGIKHIPVAAIPNIIQPFRLKKDTIANLQFQAAYTSDRGRETENLMHFQNSLKSLIRIQKTSGYCQIFLHPLNQVELLC